MSITQQLLTRSGPSRILLHSYERFTRDMHQAAPTETPCNTMFGEWLSLVEHLVRDQGVGGSNPLSPTIKSRNFN
jgi:hypothetical protein